jgi:hypothetical protein
MGLRREFHNRHLQLEARPMPFFPYIVAVLIPLSPCGAIWLRALHMNLVVIR